MRIAFLTRERRGHHAALSPCRRGVPARGPQLTVVANCAVGFENIDLQACTRHGVPTCNTPGVLTETTAVPRSR
jgi:lactate dehydrogenase-like 2-hydroxyacid dehydrogenase